jgi:hypothetical protein
MMATITKDKLVGLLRLKLDLAEGTLKEFKGKLAKNPAEAFYWSKSAFESAARGEVAKYLLDALTAKDSKADIESVRDFARQETYRFAKGGPACSTNPTANLMDLLRMAAWAEISDHLERGGLW